ncbi:putative ribonuclease H-like domain-containing protein [Tanacetum coccineum]
MAFVSTPGSTTKVNTVNVQVSTASTPVSTVSTSHNTANLSDASVYAFLANHPNGSQLVHEDLEQIHEDDLEEMDLKWQLALLSMRARKGPRNPKNRPRNQDNRNWSQDSSKRKTVNVEDTSANAMVAIDGAEFDCSFMADEEVPTNMALMAFSDSEFNKTEFDLATYKRGLASVEEQLVFYKKNEILDKLIGSQIADKSRKGVGFESYNAVAPPPTSLFTPPSINLSNSGLKEFQQPEFEEYGVKANKSVSENSSIEIRKFPDAPIIEDWVSDCDKDESEVRVLKSNNVQQKQASQPRKDNQNPRDNKTNWNEKKTQKLGVGFQFTKKAYFVCGSFNHLIKDCDFHDKRMAQKPVMNKVKKGTAVLTKSGIVPISTARQSSSRAAAPVSAARPINTAAPKSFVNVAKIMDAPGACSKGGKVTGKGNIRTGKLDFEDVYFVKELKFNLVSVSQMCDKKNNVLFTKTKCLILSPDFKLPDENQAMLKIPKKDNMYSFDLKNIVPSKGLTCLFSKATNDESKLWHRRLGHINFKTMNKLVKGNLVRGLPSKIFENDHTCVAYQKGKQHKATCKSKLVNTINQPLQILHMDLFGPTFVKSIMGKMYCLVVTNDYSRFSWVFFLAKKDETSGILKDFITGIENQLNHKVKIIRCDNGNEFKNYEMNQFYGIKGIKKEFNSLLPIPFWAEAVNTACYVQNRVLVTKPHNKTPYELLIGRTPIISFMRPFGCPVTILNTIDHLDKFDGKDDEGFLVEWLFDIDTLTNTMNYQPVSAGNRTNGNAGLETNSDAGQARKEKVLDQEYILLPLLHISSNDLSSSEEAEPSPKDDAGKKNGVKDPAKQGDMNGPGEATHTNSTNRLNTVSSPVNIVSSSFTPKDPGKARAQRNEFKSLFGQDKDDDNAYRIFTPVNAATPSNADDPLLPDLEDTVNLQDIGIFGNAYNDEDVGAEADINNLETTMSVSPIPTTRIHKDHPKA